MTTFEPCPLCHAPATRVIVGQANGESNTFWSCPTDGCPNHVA